MSVTAPRGFMASGIHCGVKPSGDPDLAIVAAAGARALPAAAVFTSNKMAAAPVVVSRSHLAATGGLAAAVILNSGNANAATGATGIAHAEEMCTAAGQALGTRAEEVLVCSTGLIGIPLPIERIVAGTPRLVEGLTAAPTGAAAAAEAILTTDTVRKESVAQAGDATVGGMAKGAAMLAPDMATMLAVITTDAAAEPGLLQQVLAAGVDASFNRLSVDGCTSTNDTVVLLASGAAGPVDSVALAAAVERVCRDLAFAMAADAEGATKVVRLRVTGARSDAEAARCARRIAESQLVKCSWYGSDPYWGRLLSEAGSAGVDFVPERAAVSYGPVTVARGGIAVACDTTALKEHMAGSVLDIVVDLGLGDGSGEVLTNDLTHGYIDENMRTS